MRKFLLVLIITGLSILLMSCSPEKTPKQITKQTAEQKDEDLSKDQMEGNSFNYTHILALQNSLDELQQKYQEQSETFDKDAWQSFLTEWKINLSQTKQTLTEEKSITKAKKALTQLESLPEKATKNLEKPQKTKETTKQNDDSLNSTLQNIESLLTKAKAQGKVKLTKEAKENTTKALKGNIQFAEEENLDAYMSSLSSHFQSDEETKRIMMDLFANFTIDYTIKNIHFKESYVNAVVVEIEQQTNVIDTPPGLNAKNSVAVIRHTLVKEKNDYKFYATEIIEQTFN